MNIYLISPLFCSIATLGLFFLVFFKNTRSPINQLFALLCIEVFYWQICWLVSYFLEGPMAMDIIVRIAFSIVVFIPFTYYHFVVLFLKLPLK